MMFIKKETTASTQKRNAGKSNWTHVLSCLILFIQKNVVSTKISKIQKPLHV